MKLVILPISEIHPYENNSRVHPQEQIEKLAESIRSVGIVKPILVDEKHTILAGHGVYEAAKLAGKTEIPCIINDSLTEEQKRAYIIADNRCIALLRTTAAFMCFTQTPRDSTSAARLLTLGFIFPAAACGANPRLCWDTRRINGNTSRYSSAGKRKASIDGTPIGSTQPFGSLIDRKGAKTTPR